MCGGRRGRLGQERAGVCVSAAKPGAATSFWGKGGADVLEAGGRLVSQSFGRGQDGGGGSTVLLLVLSLWIF